MRAELASPRPMAWHPQGSVGRELVAPPPIELLNRPDQPEHPLLHQVRQRKALTLVLACHGHHEPQVRVDEAVLGVNVAALDPLRELHLLRRGEQRMATDLGEEEIERVRAGIWRGGTLNVIGGGRVGAGPGGWRLGFLLLFDLVSRAHGGRRPGGAVPDSAALAARRRTCRGRVSGAAEGLVAAAPEAAARLLLHTSGGGRMAHERTGKG